MCLTNTLHVQIVKGDSMWFRLTFKEGQQQKTPRLTEKRSWPPSQPPASPRFSLRPWCAFPRGPIRSVLASVEGGRTRPVASSCFQGGGGGSVHLQLAKGLRHPRGEVEEDGRCDEETAGSSRGSERRCAGGGERRSTAATGNTGKEADSRSLSRLGHSLGGARARAFCQALQSRGVARPLQGLRRYDGEDARSPLSRRPRLGRREH